MDHHSNNVKIELIVLVSDIEIALESKVNEILKNAGIPEERFDRHRQKAGGSH